MKEIKVRVSKIGTIEVTEGYWYYRISQRGDFTRNKEKMPREQLAGYFEVSVPDKFSMLHLVMDGKEKSENQLMGFLAKARAIAGIKMRRK